MVRDAARSSAPFATASLSLGLLGCARLLAVRVYEAGGLLWPHPEARQKSPKSICIAGKINVAHFGFCKPGDDSQRSMFAAASPARTFCIISACSTPRGNRFAAARAFAVNSLRRSCRDRANWPRPSFFIISTSLVIAQHGRSGDVLNFCLEPDSIFGGCRS